MRTIARIYLLALGAAVACSYDASQLAGPPAIGRLDGAAPAVDGGSSGAGGQAQLDGAVKLGGSGGVGGVTIGDAPISTAGIASADAPVSTAGTRTTGLSNDAAIGAGGTGEVLGAGGMAGKGGGVGAGGTGEVLGAGGMAGKGGGVGAGGKYGTVVSPAVLTITPSAATFSTAGPTTTFTALNSGQTATAKLGATLTPSGPAFTITFDTCTGLALNPLLTCTIAVTYTPATADGGASSATATLSLTEAIHDRNQ